MRFITVSLPAIAVVAIFSGSLQRSICYTRAQAETEMAPFPETARIFQGQWAKGRALSFKQAEAGFRRLPATSPPLGSHTFLDGSAVGRQQVAGKRGIRGLQAQQELPR